jgi:hypothetical protein
MDAPAGRSGKQATSRWFEVARAAALLAMLLTVASDVQARGFGGGGRGGGIRGGGSMSMSRGGGGFSRGSFDRGSGSYRSGGTFSRQGDYSRPSSLDRKPSALDGRPSALDRPGSGSATNWEAMTKRPGGGSTTQLPANRPGGGGAGTQLPANRPGGGGSGTQLPANRPGGDGSGTKWRPDCPKCEDGWDGWIDHPIAAGIVIGAVAGAAATIGSAWYSLPADCPPYYWDSVHYYSCDGNWYAPQHEGDTIVYVTVPDPSNGQLTPAK